MACFQPSLDACPVFLDSCVASASEEPCILSVPSSQCRWEGCPETLNPSWCLPGQRRGSMQLVRGQVSGFTSGMKVLLV